MNLRIGQGCDIHRLVEGRPLVLGGVRIPYDKGLLGHSDADALLHAVIDALFGAAALGDIGSHFPDTDGQYKDASSLDLLAKAKMKISAHGFRIVNIDATIMAQKPKMAPHIEGMRDALCKALDIEKNQVSIKAKTNEGLDAVGRGEAIGALAIALLEGVD